ncbi:eukaryotic translation initiation factor 4E [Coemansia sp. IMI 203386]|nr:eukaryotic translation initiation factor 4E [Coemansia sp. IMI 203386]
MTDVKSAASAGADNTDNKTQDIKTVLGDPNDFNVVHRLNTPWTLWFDNPVKRTNVANWTANLKKVVTINTVEEFWGVYNTVAIAVDLPNGSNYHFFREGVQPMWEDPANENGGKWGYQFQRSIGEKMNEHWLHTLLACIGESFESSSEVCGAVFSNRKNCFRIAIWTRNASDKEACLNIGRHLKSVLGINQGLEYAPHMDSARIPSSLMYKV